MGNTNYAEEQFLKVLRGGGNGSAPTPPANLYVKLHTGDPGEDATANAAGNTTRQRVSFAAPANPGGTMASNIDVQWTNVPTTEDYSHFSVWDDATAGNPWRVGEIVDGRGDPIRRSVTAGDTFAFPAGSLVLTEG